MTLLEHYQVHKGTVEDPRGVLDFMFIDGQLNRDQFDAAVAYKEARDLALFDRGAEVIVRRCDQALDAAGLFLRAVAVLTVELPRLIRPTEATPQNLALIHQALDVIAGALAELRRELGLEETERAAGPDPVH